MSLLSEWYSQEALQHEEETSHRSLKEEMRFFEAIHTGDIETVRENCEQKRFADSNGVGVLSKDPLQNLKYHFVITAAMATRICTSAGMEMEQAFRLSDFYIAKLDTLNTTQAVEELHDRMVLDYTGKMRLLRNADTCAPITTCVEYIYVHIKDRITIEDLAAHTGLSTSYLSRLFKQELGISVSDYIREKKIEKAQNLLRYCDYDLIDIANYLSFSSQSHFIQAFKKLVGMTPKKYRDIYHFTKWDVTDSQGHKIHP